MVKIIVEQCVVVIGAEDIARVAHAQAKVAAGVNAGGQLYPPHGCLREIRILRLHRHSLSTGWD